MEKPIIFHTDIKVADGIVRVRLGPELEKRRVVWSESRHRTSDYEFHVVLKGAADISIIDERIRLEEGNAIIIAPDVPHQAKSRTGEFDRFYVHFSVEGDKLRDILCRKVTSNVVISVGETVIDLARKILDELSAENVYYAEIMNAMVCLLLLKVFRVAGLHTEKRPVCRVDNDMERRNIIELFFRSNMDMKKGKELLAQQLGLSERQMVRVLKKNYGMTYREKLILTRMDHAAWMLRATDETISRIAETVGYSSQKAFFQAFQAYYGMSPSRYRKSVR